MNITQKIMDRATEQIKGVLDTYRAQIDEAFLQAEDSLTISLGLTFKPAGEKIKIITPIKFVTDQVSDKFETVFDERQDELFGTKEKREYGLKPDLKMPAEYCHRERANFPARWWVRPLPDCRIEAERHRAI